jgi:arylsulfotransferase ASST/Ser-Thr-rich glycosyl-phosphatidyl-inositol-anchored membrane family protein
MKRKLNSLFWAGIVSAFWLAWNEAEAQLPTNFSAVTVTALDTNAVADGYVFLAVGVPVTNGGYYVMILKNDGTPVWYQQVGDEIYDFKLLPNGFLHYAEFVHTHSWVGGGDATHYVLDDNYNVHESIAGANGYVPESHEFQLLPNGHVLLHNYYRTQVDMSSLVRGGYPNAMISAATIQELDAQRNVVWQWRTWDHFTLNDYLAPFLSSDATLVNPTINEFHVNTDFLDDDGNLLISNYGIDVWKINRQTGQVMWRLGGPNNEFSFVDEDPAQAAKHFACHAVNRLPNGNILLYCNGDRLGTRSSKVYEYALDEVNKIATQVWSYAPSTNIYGWHRGNAQRLPNGNTFIGWGGAGFQHVPACTEVTADGRVVFQMMFNDPQMESYRAFRFVYPPQSQANQVVVIDLTAGNSYNFGNTGVLLQVNSGGGDYNSVALTRSPYAPVDPLFNGKAPLVLPVRVQLSATAITSLQATVQFDAASFNFNNPTNLTVYYRPTAGQGVFTAQQTDFNPATSKLTISLTMTAQSGQLGEFIFGFPDTTETPYPPILSQAETYRGVQPYEVIAPWMGAPGVTYSVNQQLPVSVAWSPAGFAGSYHIQIATNQDFSNPAVDVPYQTDAFYVWNGAATNTTYYWRVNTSNAGGVSDWSIGSFQTAAPFIQVTAPSGLAWRRGLSYFVRWNDNLTENVALDLYKGGSFLRSIATNAPSTGAYKWSIPASLVPGSDYSIKITSVTQNGLFDVSPQPFSIVDQPVIDATSIIQYPDGRVGFGLSAPGAATATVLASTNLVSWQVLQTVPITDGVAVFTDTSAAATPGRFYRVRVP